jgi:hypothetical protein
LGFKGHECMLFANRESRKGKMAAPLGPRASIGCKCPGLPLLVGGV